MCFFLESRSPSAKKLLRKRLRMALFVWFILRFEKHRNKKNKKREADAATSSGCQLKKASGNKLAEMLWTEKEVVKKGRNTPLLRKESRFHPSSGESINHLFFFFIHLRFLSGSGQACCLLGSAGMLLIFCLLFFFKYKIPRVEAGLFPPPHLRFESSHQGATW